MTEANAHCSMLLSPFFVAVIIAYFVSPIYEKIYGLFEKSVRGKKTAKPVRMLSLLLSYLLLVGFVTVAFVFVIPQIGESITELTNNIPVVYNNIIDMLANLHEKYPEIDTDFVSEKLNEMVPNLIKYGTNTDGVFYFCIYRESHDKYITCTYNIGLYDCGERNI